MYVNAEEQIRSDVISLKLRGNENKASNKAELPSEEGGAASVGHIDVCLAVNNSTHKNHGVIVFKGLLFALVPSALIWVGICWIISVL